MPVLEVSPDIQDGNNQPFQKILEHLYKMPAGEWHKQISSEQRKLLKALSPEEFEKTPFGEAKKLLGTFTTTNVVIASNETGRLAPSTMGDFFITQAFLVYRFFNDVLLQVGTWENNTFVNSVYGDHYMTHKGEIYMISKDRGDVMERVSQPAPKDTTYSDLSKELASFPQASTVDLADIFQLYMSVIAFVVSVQTFCDKLADSWFIFLFGTADMDESLLTRFKPLKKSAALLKAANELRNKYDAQNEKRHTVPKGSLPVVEIPSKKRPAEVIKTNAEKRIKVAEEIEQMQRDISDEEDKLRTLEPIGAAITKTIRILDAKLVLAQLEGDEERCVQINLELKDPTQQLVQHEQNVKLIKQWIGDTRHSIERKILLDKTFLDAIEQGNP